MPIHEIKPLTLRYRIYFSGELVASFYPFDDDVVITVGSGEPGGEPGEFAEHMRQCLAEWYETNQVELIGGDNEQETAKN